jgi:hypothetical protein
MSAIGYSGFIDPFTPPSPFGLGNKTSFGKQQPPFNLDNLILPLLFGFGLAMVSKLV